MRGGAGEARAKRGGAGGIKTYTAGASRDCNAIYIYIHTILYFFSNFQILLKKGSQKKKRNDKFY